jgi:hypothetical protein
LRPPGFCTAQQLAPVTGHYSGYVVGAPYSYSGNYANGPASQIFHHYENTSTYLEVRAVTHSSHDPVMGGGYGEFHSSSGEFTLLAPRTFRLIATASSSSNVTADFSLMDSGGNSFFQFNQGDADMNLNSVVNLAAGSYMFNMTLNSSNPNVNGFARAKLRLETVPEPTSMLVLGAGLATLARLKRRN